MNIKEARQKANLTQSQMAKMFEIPLRTLQHWENGDRNPPVWAEKLIVEKLNSLR